MPPTAIRLVCFDWGGVILRICRSWAEGCRRAGLPVRAGCDAAELITTRRAVTDEFQRGLIDSNDFYARLAAATGGAYDPAEVRLIHDAWLVEEYPGVAAVIDRLNAAPGVQTALLSNTNADHWARHLPTLATGAAPDRRPAGDFPTIAKLRHRHASHLLRLAKPSIEIYREFERRTGFDPGAILFFDDLPDNIAAARRAGWHAEQIDPAGDPAAQITAHLERYRIL